MMVDPRYVAPVETIWTGRKGGPVCSAVLAFARTERSAKNHPYCTPERKRVCMAALGRAPSMAVDRRPVGLSLHIQIMPPDTHVMGQHA